MTTEFCVTHDVFGGVVVCSGKNRSLTARLATVLPAALEVWRLAGVRGVWFEIELADSSWVPVCAENGFEYHHAQKGRVTMTRWLPTAEENALPSYPFTSVGVGGLVVHSSGKVLLMKEKRGSYLGWKYPGGLAEHGEDLFETAQREVLEETGVKCISQSVLTFRHQHQFWWPKTSDFYFICILRPFDDNSCEPLPETEEAAACRWFSRSEIDQLPPSEFRPFHHDILTKYDRFVKGEALGLTPTLVESKDPNRKWSMYFGDASHRLEHLSK